MSDATKPKSDTTNKRRTKSELAHQRAQIMDLYLRGKRQREIADIVGVSQPQISYDLKIVRDQWAKETTFNIDAEKNRRLAEIDVLEREYWNSWERSKTEKTVKERRTLANGRPAQSSMEKASIHGDPRFLSGVEWCISERCKILGLYAPANRIMGVSETNNSDGTRQIEAFDLTVLDVDELRNYLALVQAMKNRKIEDDAIIEIEKE